MWEAVDKAFTAEPGQFVNIRGVVLLCLASDHENIFVRVSGPKAQRTQVHPSQFLSPHRPADWVQITDDNPLDGAMASLVEIRDMDPSRYDHDKEEMFSDAWEIAHSRIGLITGDTAWTPGR